MNTPNAKGLISATLILAAAVMGGGIYYVFLRTPTSARAPEAPRPTAPALPSFDTVSFPPVRFTDVTEAARIDFVHTNGSYGLKLLPETMGSGCAFLDYDQDGDQDLLFVNSRYWDDDPDRKSV